MAEQGGGYACAACTNDIEKLDCDDFTDNNIYADNVFDCVNIDDYVFDKPGKLIGKCFYKSKDDSGNFTHYTNYKSEKWTTEY